MCVDGCNCVVCVVMCKGIVGVPSRQVNEWSAGMRSVFRWRIKQRMKAAVECISAYARGKCTECLGPDCGRCADDVTRCPAIARVM